MSDLEHRILEHCCTAPFRNLRQIHRIQAAVAAKPAHHDVIQAVWRLAERGILKANSAGGTMVTFDVTLFGNEVARQAGIIKVDVLQGGA